MLKCLIVFFICVLLLFSGTLAAQDGGNSKTGNSKAARKNSEAYSPTTAAKAQFMRESGYRNGRPGYVVAYRKPLACGGTGDIANLEWLTIAEAKTKERAERKGCK